MPKQGNDGLLRAGGDRCQFREDVLALGEKSYSGSNLSLATTIAHRYGFPSLALSFGRQCEPSSGLPVGDGREELLSDALYPSVQPPGARQLLHQHRPPIAQSVDTGPFPRSPSQKAPDVSAAT
jgi:hypothetical protein